MAANEARYKIAIDASNIRVGGAIKRTFRNIDRLNDQDFVSGLYLYATPQVKSYFDEMGSKEGGKLKIIVPKFIERYELKKKKGLLRHAGWFLMQFRTMVWRNLLLPGELSRLGVDLFYSPTAMLPLEAGQGILDPGFMALVGLLAGKYHMSTRGIEEFLDVWLEEWWEGGYPPGVH